MQKDLEGDDPMDGSSGRKTGINSYVGVGIEVSDDNTSQTGALCLMEGGNCSLGIVQLESG